MGLNVLEPLKEETVKYGNHANNLYGKRTTKFSLFQHMSRWVPL